MARRKKNRAWAWAWVRARKGGYARGDSADGMKRALFISAGLGDSLLTLPLARHLRNTSSTLVALLTSPVMTESFLQKLELFDQIELLPFDRPRRKPDWPFFRCALRHFRRFHEVYLPLFSRMWYNRRLAHWLATCCLEYTPNSSSVHDAIQNLLLVPGLTPEHALSRELITFPTQSIQKIVQGRLLPSIRSLIPYVAVQVSSCDGPFPQKSWPAENWEDWLSLAIQQFPSWNWVLVQGPREQKTVERIMLKRFPRVFAAPALSSLEDTSALLSAADLFVGLDGGLMHLAACLDVPTFTLWGASNPQLYGYQQMDRRRHHVVSMNLSCAPCESWLNPNQTRVKVARECPDFRCIRGLSATAALRELRQFVDAMR